MTDNVVKFLGPANPHPMQNIPRGQRRFSNVLSMQQFSQIVAPQSQVLLASSGILEQATGKPKMVKGNSNVESPLISVPPKRLDEMDKQQLLEHFKKQSDISKPEISLVQEKVVVKEDTGKVLVKTDQDLVITQGPGQVKEDSAKVQLKEEVKVIIEEDLEKVKVKEEIKVKQEIIVKEEVKVEKPLSATQQMAAKFAANNAPKSTVPAFRSQSSSVSLGKSWVKPVEVLKQVPLVQTVSQNLPQQFKEPSSQQTEQPVGFKLPEPKKLDANRIQLPVPGSFGGNLPKPKVESEQVEKVSSETQPEKQPKQLSAIEQRIKNLQEAQENLKQTQQQRQQITQPARVLLPSPTLLQQQQGQKDPPQVGRLQPSFLVNGEKEEQKQPELAKAKPLPGRIRGGTVSEDFLTKLNGQIGGPPKGMGMMGMGMMGMGPRPVKIEEPKAEIEVDYSETNVEKNTEQKQQINLMMMSTLGGRLPNPNFNKPVQKQEEGTQEENQQTLLLARAAIKVKGKRTTLAFDQ